ncbi:MAG: tetratricopeptide repeat protein [Deltaproteobacteria bacterium]|nr:tetratricopeptide repeat protein [Deltaproteobacteria bacterium]
MPPLAILFLSLAAATPANDEVEAAVQAYLDLDFEAVAPALEHALRHASLSRADSVIAWAYLGRAHAVFHRNTEAVRAFAKALELDPDVTVGDDESPLVRSAFLQAKRSAGPPSAANTAPAGSLPPTPAASTAPTGAAATSATAPQPAPDRIDWFTVSIVLEATAAVAGGVALTYYLTRDRTPKTTLGEWRLP